MFRNRFPLSRSPFWFGALLTVVPSLALAEPLAQWAKQRVEQGLIQPLTQSEHKRSKFSRARMAPPQRRVRILQTTYSTDKKGHKFVPFAVDAGYGSEWRNDDIVGCVYQGSADLFVQVGDEYRPAQFLLGKEADAVPGACEAAPSES
ncbi:MAG: hypothetical protein RJA70_4842 [Pseudomonadota bacterium]|jgi:hypothetical protein